MSYRLERDEPVGFGIRRVILEQVDGAIESLGTLDDDPAGAIHDARKRTKMIRAAARLVRDAIGDDYAAINATARDAARELAGARDASALAATFRDLHEQRRDSSDHAGMVAVASALDARGRAAEQAVAERLPHVERARTLLDQLRDRTTGLAFGDEGWDAIEPGLARTYRRGRRAMRAARTHPTGANFHEWRKRAKYTRHHLDLLAGAAPGLLVPLEDEFHRLTDALGDAHDLHVLAGQLTDGSLAAVASDRELRDVLATIERARRERELEAIGLGRLLYAEPTGRFTDRLGRYRAARAR